MSRVSLYAMDHHYHLLDDFDFPEKMDKQIMKDTIIYYNGQLIPWIQQPEFLKININTWFKRMKENFSRMYEALNLEYNPIYNYNRYDDWNDKGSSKLDSKNNTVNGGDVTTTDTVSAFNSPNYQPNMQNIEDLNTTSDTTIDSLNNSESEHKGHSYGNIGVTRTVTMIHDELSIRVYDLYKTIAEMFEKEFLLQYY